MTRHTGWGLTHAFLLFAMGSAIPAAGCASGHPDEAHATRASAGAAVPPAGSPTAASNQPHAAAPGRVRIEYNLFLELHAELTYAARNGASPLLDTKAYAAEIADYAKASGQVKDFKTWQFVYDTCASALDISAIKEASGKIPAGLQPGDREAARQILGALQSAWTRFESKDVFVRQRGLKVFTTQIMNRVLSAEHQDQILLSLYEKLSLKPLDAPITVFMVTDAPDVGAWGKTAQGFYLVVPVQNRP
ncbi:MAG TPA: hypothetical protein VFG76_02115, partial [Candidatus Polarisedimenticolia bacterium]|nr:hypothetical protein [Candidatus Polarisedimenticolia bacterium]